MPIKVVELHHHGIRIGTTPDDLDKAKDFYSNVLGLEQDTGRPNIPGIPGFWMYVGQGEQTTQIHLMGAVGQSPVARSEREDPALPHVALAVEDIVEARQELERQGVWHYAVEGLVGEDSAQVFVRDPFGNIIELHQVGTCRCNKIVVNNEG